jgi:chaperonin cofactor prefoldin
MPIIKETSESNYEKIKELEKRIELLEKKIEKIRKKVWRINDDE